LPSPKALINALQAHWDVVEHLVLLARTHPAFEMDQVLAIVARTASDQRLEVAEGMIRQMVSADLLQPVPRGTALQLHPLVLDFVRGLTREHELGLSAVLQARVEAITTATAKLTDGLQAQNFDQLRQAAYQLSELFRQISQQLDQDRHAILEIAERAKAADANLPIARRYREVLAAYDEYIAPMAEMMDSGPGGTFYRHLEAAEHALDHAVETLAIQGALYTDRQNMRHVTYRAKELRRLGREVLKQCSDTLLPLREEIRQHNTLSGAISGLLGQIRKRGLTATLRSRGLPLWRRELPRRVGIGGEVLTLMAEALNYQPQFIVFPDEVLADVAWQLEHVEESTVLAELLSALPIADLLDWLHERFPTFSDATVLRLYHALIVRTEWLVEVADQPRQLPLNTLRVTHHPHGLLPSAVA